MTDVMKSILSRVLSEEIAHQEQWEKQDIENFGKSMTDRKGIIKEIKDFMKDNDIKFNDYFYFNA